MNIKKIDCTRNELQYKTFKTRLKNVLRAAEKLHYQNLLQKYSNDAKKSWSIIKNIIDKNKRPQVQTRFKLPNGNETTNSTLISEKFNDFFYKHWSHTF